MESMFGTMSVAALAIDGLFSVLGLIPSGAQPTRDDIFGSVQVDHKLVLDLLGVVVFAMHLLAYAASGRDGYGARHEDRLGKAVATIADGQTMHFCSYHCRDEFESYPSRCVRTEAAIETNPTERPAAAPAHEN
jgi:hypothetical protein